MTHMLQVEARLAQHPWHALFFSVFAVYVYAVFIFSFAGSLFPTVAEAAAGNGPDAIRINWIMQVLLQGAIFLHLTLWAERVGAGAFAGRLVFHSRWLTLALFAAPLLHIAVLRFSFSVFAGGETDWIYESETARAFLSQAALGPMMILSVLVLAPLVEEMTFRGVLMGFLLGRKWPSFMAIGTSAIAFTAIHLQYKPAALFSVFVLGLFLGWLRVASKSLGPPILAHMAINLIGLISLANAPVSGG